ncbi:MAG: trypsin-like peptidase domain-containing protein [Acidimicrobiales bacterium]
MYRDDGYLVTNHHVIEDASSLYVGFSEGRAMPARVVGADAASDLAVLKVKATGLPPLDVRSHPVVVGEPCLALGSPLDYPHSVSFGVISAVGRRISDEDGDLFDLVQTDADINPGNSGGALIDVEGRLIGVPTIRQVWAGEDQPVAGLNFAVPAATVSTVVEILIEHGAVSRARLGVQAAERTVAIDGAVVRAVVIEGVHPDQGSDVRIGDVLIKVNNQRVTSRTELHHALSLHPAERLVHSEVYRDGAFLPIAIRPLASPAI